MSLISYTGAAIFDGQKLHTKMALLVKDGVIIAIDEPGNISPEARQETLRQGYLTHGFVDLQVNGGGGVQFNDTQTVEALETIFKAHHRTGTRGIMPTLITDTPDRSQAAIQAVIDAMNSGVSGILGLHLEGPHLSIARKGAHDRDLIRPMSDADLKHVCQAALRIPNVMMTLAPESVTLDQVKALAQAGVIVSLGHSDTDYDTAMRYMDAGAHMVTHLFNAMSGLGSRKPGLVGAALEHPNCSAGLIADGHHVHPATIRRALAANQGPGNVFLVSDAMSCVGSDITEFTLNGRPIYRKGGCLRLADGTLAGADIDMPRALRFMVQEVGVDPETALGMATTRPAGCLPNGPASFDLIGCKLDNILYLGADFSPSPLPKETQ